jgi:hypothetical protein
MQTPIPAVAHTIGSLLAGCASGTAPWRRPRPRVLARQVRNRAGWRCRLWVMRARLLAILPAAMMLAGCGNAMAPPTAGPAAPGPRSAPRPSSPSRGVQPSGSPAAAGRGCRDAAAPHFPAHVPGPGRTAASLVPRRAAPPSSGSLAGAEAPGLAPGPVSSSDPGRCSVLRATACARQCGRRHPRSPGLGTAVRRQ